MRLGRPPAIVYGAADTTLREIVHLTLGGPTLRVVFTNEFGTDSLTIAAANVGLSAGGSAIDLANSAGLTFAGRTQVVVPPGALVVSDPVALKVAPQSDLAISLFLPAQPIPAVSAHGSADQTSYTAPGNVVGAKSLDTPTEIFSWPFVKAVDVKVSAASAAVVALGDSITEQYQYSTDIELYLTTRFPSGNFTFINAGIGGDLEEFFTGERTVDR